MGKKKRAAFVERKRFVESKPRRSLSLRSLALFTSLALSLFFFTRSAESSSFRNRNDRVPAPPLRPSGAYSLNSVVAHWSQSQKEPREDSERVRVLLF